MIASTPSTPPPTIRRVIAQDTFYLAQRPSPRARKMNDNYTRPSDASRDSLVLLQTHSSCSADPSNGKSNRRRCGSSCRAGFIAATTPTPRITRPSSRSKDFTWTKRHRRRPQGHGRIRFQGTAGRGREDSFSSALFQLHRAEL